MKYGGVVSVWKTKHIIGFIVSVLCLHAAFSMDQPNKVSAAPITHPMADNKIDFKEDRERAHEWGVTSYRTWLRGLTLIENRAIDQYFGGDYRNINNYIDVISIVNEQGRESLKVSAKLVKY